MRTLLAACILLFAAPSMAAAAPDWQLTSTDGETVTLSATAAEQPVLLFFWASWCPYCKALIPHLESLRLEYGDELRIMAINFRDDGDPAGYLDDLGYELELFLDGEEVAGRYEVWGTPGVLLVDREREIRFDLRDLPTPDINKEGHRRKAAVRAPYWAAEIRKAIDALVAD